MALDLRKPQRRPLDLPHVFFAKKCSEGVEKALSSEAYRGLHLSAYLIITISLRIRFPMGYTATVNEHKDLEQKPIAQLKRPKNVGLFVTILANRPSYHLTRVKAAGRPPLDL